MFELRKKLIRVLPRKIYLKLLYYRLFGRKLNLDDPRLFTEKLFWLKRYYEKNMPELLNIIHDKYTARQYVKEIIGDEYLSTVYGVYDDASEIEFDELPEKFMLKLTKLNGRNIPCMNKNDLDKAGTVKKLNDWLREASKASKISEEGYMLEGKTRIICEESLFTSDGLTPLEYTVHCFNGKAKFIIIDNVLNDAAGSITGVIRNVYDLNWNLVPIDFGRKHDATKITEKPKNLNELISIAEKLSVPFPYVRVDLYNIDEKIIFRELTWIPMGGNIKINPFEFDKKIGELLTLPNWKFY